MTTSVSTSELKTRCGQIVASVAKSRQEVVITKRGRPVARLVPIAADEGRRSLFGCLRGSVRIHGDIVEPIEVTWEAEETGP